MVIRLRVLGSIELIDSKGHDLRAILAQPKRLGLLAYLAAAPGTFHRRDTLLGLFWPELDEPHARSALSQAIHFLRRELGSSAALENRGAEEIRVNRTLLWCDAASFLDDVEAERFGEALELYRGDFLSGFFIECGPECDHWLEATRARFRFRAATAARRFAEAREHDQSYTTAVASARRAVDLSGADERVVCELLGLLDRLGDRAGAVRAYEVFAHRLVEECGVEPAAETKAVIDRIRNRDALVRQSRPAGPQAVGLESRVSPASSSNADVPDFNGWRPTHEIGRGGVATVYLAKDAKHDRSVALKVIPFEHASSVGGERFMRESQILARLAHPHILPLIDSGAAAGAFWLVTPYIAGGSLRMRLRAEGHMPVDDTVRIAGEVASALEYAHRHGVIHRDIKPENILLQDGHAIVADFGIAMAVSGHADACGIDGRSPGTPGYMSPEQVRGDTNVGAPSDVYSLGAVLYEMLTGKPPEAETTSARALGPDVPPHVARAIRRALSAAPSDRFASAEAFSRALNQPVVLPRSRVARLPLIAAGAVLFGALIGATVVAHGAGFGLGRSLIAAGTLRPAERVIVTDFRVAGIDSGIGTAVGYAARSALTQARDIRVVSSDNVAAALQRMRRSPALHLDLGAAREVAAREGVRTIVDGHVVRTGSTFDVGLRLVSADSGRDLVALHASASTLDDIIPVIDRLTRVLRSKIGESVSTVEESPPLPRMTTRSIEALRFFAEYHRVSEWAQKRVFLERAVAADSEFAEAWRQLAAVYFNLGIPDGNPLRDSAEAKAYRYRAGLTRVERLRIEARHYAMLGDRERHMQALEQSLLFGDSVFALNGLGESYWRKREFAKAEQLQRTIVRINPIAILGYSNVVEKLVEQGKFDAADSVVDIGLSRMPKSWALVKSRTRLLYHRGQFDAYRRTLDSVRSVADPVARRAATAVQRDLALVRGQLREWARLRPEAVSPEVDNAGNSELVDEALVFLWIRGDTARAAERFQRAVVIGVPTRPRLLQYGSFFALTGRNALARDFLKRFESAADTSDRRRYEYLVHRLRGDLARADGRIDESLSEIRQGDRLPDGPVDACVVCLYASLGYTFDRAAMTDSAIAMFERYANTPNAAHISQDRWHLPRILNRLGQLHEAKGNRDAAIRYYERFVNLWANADPELQPRVAVARRRLARLKRST